MQVWEVKVIDQADFDAELFCELFADEELANDIGEEQLKLYREGREEDNWPIVLQITSRTLHPVDTGRKGN